VEKKAAGAQKNRLADDGLAVARCFEARVRSSNNAEFGRIEN
jgi:hypothetical protein